MPPLSTTCKVSSRFLSYSRVPGTAPQADCVLPQCEASSA